VPDAPREYDREYINTLSDRAQIRVGFSTDRGEVTRFVAQLETRFDDTWIEVVRFDHDPASEHGHDVSVEGVHMDVYREGAQLRTEEIFPPMPAGQALTFAEDHLAMHHERYITRFDEWHRTDPESR
jgi:hypothetical protein